jgi:hypothetical protein
LSSPQRSILYIAAEYRVAELKAKKHEHNLEARHASGYFDRVWSVHPTADLVGADKHRIQLIRFSSKQLVVEGVTELFRLPRSLMPLNFLLSQAALLRLMWRLVRKHDISVVAATDPFLSGIQAWLLSKLTGKPLVIRNGIRTRFPCPRKDSSFYTMRTDSLDRFGTRLEHRFSRAEIEKMMHDAGLGQVRFSETMPYWVAVGRRR